MEVEVSKKLEQLQRDLAAQRAANEELETDLKQLRADFDQYRRDKQEEESQRLKTALIAAGGVIIALAGFVWYEIIWPVIQAGRSQ